MNIRISTEEDKGEIETIHLKAFGEKKGPEIATLVNELFDDETALPLLSLVAEDAGRLIGHIMYTKADLVHIDSSSVSVQLLAPLAVIPEAHKKGVGTSLINEGLRILKETGVELVFVLGHPDYYPRCGFTPAGVHGFGAPYPIPEEYADAWMVHELYDGVIGRVTGTVKCSDMLSQPQHWRE